MLFYLVPCFIKVFSSYCPPVKITLLFYFLTFSLEFECLKLLLTIFFQTTTKERTTSMRLAKFQTESIAQSLQCQYRSLSTVFAPILCLSWFQIDCPIIPLRDYSILLSTRPLSPIDRILFPWNMQLQSGSSQITFTAMSWRYFNY